ncbi:MAG: hypothetical protein A2X61_13175 [Ignavibacteria bacterium GWB2_35_12]|nr:MAG: hypothetical protein A2X63_12385 [Ignavibacteria bacterium GWA2_35_8]OGU41413.1 MAG: hypothetical protein A2X61_13175 [Ignavibacteria bacterium GWB2_35_12]OGV19411.1 MAG: hypothetical protein A2475_04915 [Ignavibacteria bacterium RIFOXYC2_FULL_35_21]
MKKLLLYALGMIFLFNSNIFCQSLNKVKFWAYQIQSQDENNSIQNLVDSKYELIVIDNPRTVVGKENYDNAADITQLKNSKGWNGENKIVVCYIDIGEVEDYRYYWKQDWRVGNPDWIVANDPDGWDGNFPVKYWRQEWKNLMFGSDTSMIDMILADGYDGIYLDWVEAFEFEPVMNVASADGLNSRNEMIKFIEEIAQYCRTKKPGFLVIPQNATAIIYNENWEPDSLSQKYFNIIDAVAQENIWFDGDADPLGQLGDIPEDAGLTLEYITNLSYFQNAGKPIFTVDYAQIPANVDSCYRAAKRLEFIEYVSLRQLDKLTDTPPPDYTGVDDNDNNQSIFLYPNPVKDILNIRINKDLNYPKLKVLLFDLLGNKILEKDFNQSLQYGGSIGLDIKHLNAGFYYVQLILNSTSSYFKIIKL